MISNVTAFNRSNTRIGEILANVERVSDYNGLSEKNVLHLRLLAEEVCCMIDSLVQFFEGEFWMENDGTFYSLHLSLNADEMSRELKNELISASTSGKNASAKGIIGRIREVVQDYAMWYADSTENTYRKVRDTERGDYTSAWYLSDLRKEGEKNPAMWDDLGRSILLKLADDIVVGISGSKIVVTVKKNFGGVN